MLVVFVYVHNHAYSPAHTIPAYTHTRRAHTLEHTSLCVCVSLSIKH